MNEDWLDSRGSLLGSRCPLPLDAPFTTQMAHDLGVSRRTFESMKGAGLVRPVLRGVYAATQAPHDLLGRAQALALVIPPSAVVSDRTAAWLHGVDILPRTALTVVPDLDVVHVDDTRVSRDGVDGRRRGLVPSDVTTVHGIQVTTALRTSLDLGRLLWRFDALAAIDGFLRIGVPHELLLAEMGRFRGYRGVRQLRVIAPLGDPRAESPGESALRLHWIDAGLPKPELQWWVHADDGVPVFRLDLADPDVRYGAEYNGEEFHSSPADQEYDEQRRMWLSDERDWSIDWFTKHEVYRRGVSPIDQLVAGHGDARRRVALWTPRHRSA